MTATPFKVKGLENLLTDRSCVLVANHASYLDGYVMIGAIPDPFSFVAKAELKEKPAVSKFLKRIDTLFVERVDKQQAAEDARRISNAVRDNKMIMYFPEGTFKRMPGVLPFHMGAFVTAVENQAPVIPVAIRGTRSILRADSWFPRRGQVSVSIGEPIFTQATPDGHDSQWKSAVALRDKARQHILQHIREPDLAN